MPPRRADLALVDQLAHLQLVARRAGGYIRLHGVDGELRALLQLVGLAEELGVEVSGEAEGSEKGGVEEVVVPEDPVS